MGLADKWDWPISGISEQQLGRSLPRAHAVLPCFARVLSNRPSRAICKATGATVRYVAVVRLWATPMPRHAMRHTTHGKPSRAEPSVGVAVQCYADRRENAWVEGGRLHIRPVPGSFTGSAEGAACDT